MAEPRYRVRDFESFLTKHGLTDREIVFSLSSLARHGPDQECADCGAVLFSPHKGDCVVNYVDARLSRLRHQFAQAVGEKS